MKNRNNYFHLIQVVILLIITGNSLFAQRIDTLVDVGGYKLHFNIIKGNGTPILFEAGSGAYGSDWDTLLAPIHKVTGTTLITYDRSGFGKSELNYNDTNILNHGIINGITELETGLKKLGYDKDIILVCHSYGGFYSTLFASRHAAQVKYVIRLDASLVTAFTDDNLKKYHSFKVEKTKRLGIYYETINFQNTIRLMRKIEFPSNVPVIDIIAGIPYHHETEEQIKEFEKSHVDFVAAEPNRKLIKADGSEHDIKYDNPSLVINSIIKAYSETLSENQKCQILGKALDNAIDLSNQTKNGERTYRTSEYNLNDLGYIFLEQNNIKKALEVFKLNVSLFPTSWIAFDSYGEALLQANNKPEAAKMYKKSLELNPNNETAKLVLKKLKQ